MKTATISYQDQDPHQNFIGFYAYEEHGNKKKPAILICHDWSGRNAFAEKKAQQLAQLGFVAFAVDLYGEGQQGATKEEKMNLMQPLIKNRDLIRSRLFAALKALKSIEIVDHAQLGVIGYCFGGLCALDLARNSNDIKGTVSFHGSLKAPEPNTNSKITSKILVLHGYDDPTVTPHDVMTFAQEMTKREADWQIHLYGHTAHAFTNPEAHDKDAGLIYNAAADKRSWLAMKNFFTEVFGE